MPSSGQLQTVFDAFGWEITPEFRERYLNDPWTYNMANAMVELHERVQKLTALIGGPCE